MNRRGALMIVVALLMPGIAFAQTAVNEVHDAVIRGPNLQPLSKTRYLLIYTDPAPEYIALLFAGGNGFLNIPNNGQIPASGLGLNFLVRSRLDFVKDGVAVAVVDAPNKIPLSPESKRMTAGYAASIAAVVTDVRRVLRNPAEKVWLVGTSSGTISAVEVAAQYPQAKPKNPGSPDGVILTSAQIAKHTPDTVSSVRCTQTIFDVTPPLASINVPILNVTSRGDKCPCSTISHPRVPGTVPVNSPTHGHVEIDDGGSQPGADVCSALTGHGFFDKEKQAVKAITDWIKTH